MNDNDWWRGAVFYQIYPRSFKDTNGDGIGDLRGITDKLDYVASLGVDGIWTSPFFKSPMKDFGYDVSDYRDIDPMFGSLQDFDDLLKRAHELKLKIIVDLVLSHTSDQHPWFEASCDPSHPEHEKFKDWYVWADPKPDGSVPNNWVSVFDDVPAWAFNKKRGQYYLHNFLPAQPDLNYHNPDVQEAALDVAKFWLERGVDGFRLDVVNFYFHDKALRDNPARPLDLGPATQFTGAHLYSEQQHIHDKTQPENLEFIRRFRKLMDRYPGTMTVGEIGDDDPYMTAARYTAGEDHLHTTYNTQMMNGVKKGMDVDLFKVPEQKVKKYQKELGGGFPSWAFSNHDVVRAASRWHPDPDNHSHDPRLSKMLVALLGSLRGTVFLYQGEELGLPEGKIPFDKIQDPWGKSTYEKGWQGRDGCRTPMPWDDSECAGFTETEPWLPVPAEHKSLSVTLQEKDAESVLQFTRRLLQWRKSRPDIILADIKFIETGDDKILAFRRGDITCLFNLSHEKKLAKIKSKEDKTLPPYGFSIEGFDIN